MNESAAFISRISKMYPFSKRYAFATAKAVLLFPSTKKCPFLAISIMIVIVIPEMSLGFDFS